MPHEMWAEKYRPTTLDEYRGSTKTVKKVMDWAKNWENRKSKAVLLHGPPGSGKTALANLVAEELDYELYETNASDVRTKKALQDSLEKAVQQRSFTGKTKLILIDEVDGMSSNDRGGKSEIKKILDKTKFPVILTANDAYANGMQSIRRQSNTFEMKSVHTNSIAAQLRDIAEEENVQYDKGTMKSIARRAGGDMRSAINDLQSLAEKHEQITSDLVKELGYRDTETGIFDALKIIFKTTTAQTASTALDDVDETYDTLFEWIRENVPKEYKKNRDVARAMDNLSQADVFKGRMVTRQNWRLLKYVYNLMTVGVALSKDEKYKGFTRYGYPSRIKKLGRSKAKRRKRQDIGSKVAETLHTSVSTGEDMIPFLQQFFADDGLKDNIITHMELTDDEVSFIEDY